MLLELLGCALCLLRDFISLSPYFVARIPCVIFLVCLSLQLLSKPPCFFHLLCQFCKQLGATCTNPQRLLFYLSLMRQLVSFFECVAMPNKRFVVDARRDVACGSPFPDEFGGDAEARVLDEKNALVKKFGAPMAAVVAIYEAHPPFISEEQLRLWRLKYTGRDRMRM